MNKLKTKLGFKSSLRSSKEGTTSDRSGPPPQTSEYTGSPITPKASPGEVVTATNDPLFQVPHDPTSNNQFKSLIKRSIASWSLLTYVGDPKIKAANMLLLSSTLKGFASLDDLFKSKITFWFFQSKKSFLKQEGFMKWDSNRLDEYILLPVSQGWVNKKNCFYVSHFWRTKDHPDPKSEDFKLVRSDIASQSWDYVWVDWTCVPQSPRSDAQEEYMTKMLLQSTFLMRSCAFEWRYPAFQPRLWILLEVAQYMLTGANESGWTPTPDMIPFVRDVEAMKKDGTRKIVREKEYKCSIRKEYRLLVGWLELLVIISQIVTSETKMRAVLDSVDLSNASTVTDYDTGIRVDKINGIVCQGTSVYRFAPLWPVDKHGIPEELEDPTQLEPPACVEHLVKIMKSPELSACSDLLAKREQTLGADHQETIATVGKLANTFIELKQFREAEHLRRRVFSSREKTLGPENPETLEAINDLGATLHMQKRFKESSVLFKQYLTAMTKIKGRPY